MAELQQNNSEGVRTFCRKKWLNLQKLHLANNHFGPNGALALSNGTFLNYLNYKYMTVGSATRSEEFSQRVMATYPITAFM